MNTANQYPDFTGLTFEKVWTVIMKTNQSVAELKQLNVEAEARWEKIIQESRQSVETTTQELKKSQKNLNKQLGDLSNKMGQLVETFMSAGLYVVRHRGDNVKITVPEGFVPKVF